MKREKPSTESLGVNADGKCGVKSDFCSLLSLSSSLDRGLMAQSGCQAFSVKTMVDMNHSKSRVVCEYNPKQVVNSI